MTLNGPSGPSDVLLQFQRLRVGYSKADAGRYYESANCAGIPYLRWDAEKFPTLDPTPKSVVPATGEVRLPNGPLAQGAAISSYSFYEEQQQAYVCADASNTTFPPTTVFYPAAPAIDIYNLYPPPYDVVLQ